MRGSDSIGIHLNPEHEYPPATRTKDNTEIEDAD